MIKFRFMLLICIWFALPSCAQARVKASERYVLRWKTVKMPPYDLEEWDVWLWDRQKKRVLWKRHMDSFSAEGGVHWSQDRRALAIEGGIPSQWRFLVWREGYRLRDFGVPGGDDYTMGCAWSPDNRRLLVRSGSSGDSTADIGALYCLRLKSWPNYKYFNLGSARDFKWKNRKTVVFWDVDFDDPNFDAAGDTPAPLIPHTWHAP